MGLLAQIFHRSANSLAKVSIVSALLLVSGIVWAAYRLNAGAFTTGVDVAVDQPVPFSHKHHVADDGIDCRYCHTSVETSSFRRTSTDRDVHELPLADLDQRATCSSRCARASKTGKSLEWTRVHDLPDFVYFNHSIHVNKGIGCSTCHGRVDLMPLMYKVNTLYMQWCIAATAIRKRTCARAEVFNPAYHSGAESGRDRAEAGRGIQNSKPDGLRDVSSMKYWRSLEELAETEEFRAFVEDEFPNRTPDWNDPESAASF